MIEIKVPATSANIGPGFDCLGVALNIYNRFFIEEIDEGLIIEGCEEQYANEHNLTYQAMQYCFKEINYQYDRGIKIKIEGEIPVSRGLGSSAACIVAGVIGANAIAGDILNKEEILKIATEIEGHPDNVAPALMGGIIVSIQDRNEVYYSRIAVAKNLDFYAMIPSFKLSTEKARAVLPKTVPYRDAVFNVGRTAMMISALVNGELELLKIASQDRLHQGYRSYLIEEYDKIIEKCNSLCLYGTFLSGAGPTIMAIDAGNSYNEVKFNELYSFVSTLNNTWDLKRLSIENQGTTIRKR